MYLDNKTEFLEQLAEVIGEFHKGRVTNIGSSNPEHIDGKNALTFTFHISPDMHDALMYDLASCGQLGAIARLRELLIDPLPSTEFQVCYAPGAFAFYQKRIDMHPYLWPEFASTFNRALPSIFGFPLEVPMNFIQQGFLTAEVNFELRKKPYEIGAPTMVHTCMYQDEEGHAIYETTLVEATATKLELLVPIFSVLLDNDVFATDTLLHHLYPSSIMTVHFRWMVGIAELTLLHQYIVTGSDPSKQSYYFPEQAAAASFDPVSYEGSEADDIVHQKWYFKEPTDFAKICRKDVAWKGQKESSTSLRILESADATPEEALLACKYFKYIAMTSKIFIANDLLMDVRTCTLFLRAMKPWMRRAKNKYVLYYVDMPNIELEKVIDYDKLDLLILDPYTEDDPCMVGDFMDLVPRYKNKAITVICQTPPDLKRMSEVCPEYFVAGKHPPIRFLYIDAHAIPRDWDFGEEGKKYHFNSTPNDFITLAPLRK